MTHPPIARRDFARSLVAAPFLVPGLARAAQQPAGPWVDVRSFGAVGDGQHDDAPAIQAAIAAVRGGGRVLLPPGRFALGTTIRIPSLVLVQGAGSRASELYYRVPDGNVVEMGDGTHDVSAAGLEAVRINGAGTTGVGLRCYYLTNGTFVRDVEVAAAGTGVQLTKAWYAHFENVRVRDGIQGAGWDIRTPSGAEQVNSVAFIACQAHGCGQEGFRIDVGRGCTFLSCQSEKTGAEAFRIGRGGGVVIMDCYAEANGTAMQQPVALQVGTGRRVFGFTLIGGYLRGPAGGDTIRVGPADAVHILGTALEIEAVDKRPAHHLVVDPQARDVHFDAAIISSAAGSNTVGPVSRAGAASGPAVAVRSEHPASYAPVYLDRATGQRYVLGGSAP